MDYQELSGVTISEQDKAFAKEFANFVNGRMCSAENTGRELTRAHRRCSRCLSVLCASWHTTIRKVLTMTATSGLHGLHRKRTPV